MDWLDLLAVQGLSRGFSNTTVQSPYFDDVVPGNGHKAEALFAGSGQSRGHPEPEL